MSVCSWDQQLRREGKEAGRGGGLSLASSPGALERGLAGGVVYLFSLCGTLGGAVFFS